jgi:hypothetical protein
MGLTLIDAKLFLHLAHLPFCFNNKSSREVLGTGFLQMLSSSQIEPVGMSHVEYEVCHTYVFARPKSFFHFHWNRAMKAAP